MNRRQRVVFYAIWTAAIFFRFSLAILNREANDDHMQVVHLILQQGRLPVKADCWECFQPKLFHYSVATLIKLFGVAIPDGQILVAQMLNLVLGLLMLLACWKLLQKVEIGDMDGKLMAFGLIALNPNLVTTDIQATNDTFVIAFSTLAIYFAYRFISDRTRTSFVLLTIFSILAASSKTNGLLTVVGIAAFMVIRAIQRRNFSFHWPASDLFPAILYGLVILIFVLVNPLNQYVENLKLYGTPLVMNMDRAELPQLFTPTEVNRPGIISVQDGFFTFKLIDLIANPQINRDNKNYPANRTSFWTVLYGRSNFIQYNPWPLSWVNDNRWVRMLGRVIFVLALLPTAVLIIGFLRGLREFKPADPENYSKDSIGLFITLFVAFLVFAILYAIEYRIYTVIKTIFIFPAIISLGVFFLVGYDWVKKISQQNMPILNLIYPPVIYCLLVAYGLDISILVFQLAKIQGVL